MLSDRDHLSRSRPATETIGTVECVVPLHSAYCGATIRSGMAVYCRPWNRCSEPGLRRPPLPAVVSTAVIPRDADRVAILINPKAGRKAAHPRADRLAELLRRAGLQDGAVHRSGRRHSRRPTSGTPRAVCGRWSGQAATARPPNWSTAPPRAFRSRCCRPATPTCWPGTSTSARIPRPSAARWSRALSARIDAGRGQRPNLPGDGQLRLRRRSGPARPRPPHGPRHRLFLLQADRRSHLEL